MTVMTRIGPRPAEMGEMTARSLVLEIEALYLIAQSRRLSNSETHDLARMSSALAERAEREASVRVPEHTPIGGYSARYW